MFLFLLVFIMVCCFFEKNGRNWAFHAAWLVLTAVLCFRFAQGRDYRTYWMMYYYGDGHSEFLWRCITKMLNSAGVPFEAFIFGISLFMMYGIRRAVLRFSPYQCFSLLLFYPTLYFSYFFSALRAGILIAFFLGFMLDWLIEKKYKRYLAAALLLLGVHSMAAAFLPLMFIQRIREKVLLCAAAVSAGMGFFLIFTNGWILKLFHLERLNYYLGEAQFAAAAFLEKLFIFGAVWFLYSSAKKDKVTGLLYKICIYGMVISMPFLGFQLISSRLFHLLTAVHIVAVPLMIKKMSYTVNRKLIKTVFFLYTVVILSKNINYYIESMIPGRYHIISCPYITIFQKEKTNEVFGEIYTNGRFW